MNTCFNCKNPTENPKYCSRSCSAIVNNSVSKKRGNKKSCKMCRNPIRDYKSNLCEMHWEEKKIDSLNRAKNTTLEEYHQKESVLGKHPSWANSHVRALARSWLKDLKKLPCAHCGYSKHVELAHIKSISSFDKKTPLGVINSPDNVIQLCPNCHWEFDNLPR